MAKEIDIRFPAREGHSVQWKLSKGQIATLTKKYGDAALRKKIVPKIRARVRTWYGPGRNSKKETRNWWINIDTTTKYNLLTGKFAKR